MCWTGNGWRGRGGVIGTGLDAPSAARRGCRGGERKAPCIASIEDNFVVRNSPLAGLDAPTPARIGTGRPMGRSIASSGDRRFPKGERKALWCARRRKPLHPAGPDAPTPARIGTGRPKGCSHFSFGGERKVCKRKPAARRLREKALYCPFLKEGVRNVARSTVGLPT